MSKTILIKEQENNIINSYMDGMSINKLGKEYNVSPGTIRRALMRNNIHIRTIQRGIPPSRCCYCSAQQSGGNRRFLW